MSTRLERLLGNITTVPDRIDRFCDVAFNSFPPPPAVIGDWDQYCAFLARFHSHMESGVLGIGHRQPDPQIDLSRCWRLLKGTFGDSAPQTCFEIARTGVEGGVPHLLRTVASHYAKAYAENLIGLAVEAYCSNRSAQELLADANEYVATYRHVLPGEIAEASAARVLANFRKVLKQHPFVVRQLRQTQGARR